MPDIPSRGRYGRFLRGLLSVIDLLMVNVLFGVLCLIHPEILDHYARLKWLLVSVSYVPVAVFLEHWRVERSLHIERIVVGAVEAVVVHALVFVTLLSFLNADDFPVSYYWLYYSMMLAVFVAVWIGTRLFLKYMRGQGRNFSRVVVVGTNPTARRLGESLTFDESYGYRLLGFFDKSPAPGFRGTYCGPLDRLDSFLREFSVDEVFFALSGENEEELLQVIKICDDNVVQFHYVPKISPYVGRRFEMTNVGGLPVLTPQINPLSKRVNRLLKRAFDLAFSSVVLLFSPIIFIPIAIAVKISSPGPVFFKQKRTGYRGREFTCLKFRTMKINSDSDRKQATDRDPRKTRVGDFLRRTSLDELPQFINVWMGDMSVVGPRPHMLAHTEQYRQLIDRYMLRHMVKPGITGWAQVSGYRGNTDELWKMEKRVNADVWYIEHWSWMLDLKIIVRTVYNAIRGEENAY
ncbi:MAG: undecaprenyl-phosphate glucose phosphotransferase [Bacteroides sp.]|nr:undecaprenyl-phosphate glucose phosphotransferase [Bacteroides sp.]